MAYPVRLTNPAKDQDPIIMVLQLESLVNKRSNKTVGFSTADEQVLKLVTEYLAMQFEKNVLRKEINTKDEQIIDTIQLTSEISNQQHFTGLFKAMREYVPKFFGYMGCGVLIYDRGQNTLFADPDFTTLTEAEKAQNETPDQLNSDDEDIEIGLTNNIHQAFQRKRDKTPVQEVRETPLQRLQTLRTQKTVS